MKILIAWTVALPFPQDPASLDAVTKALSAGDYDRAERLSTTYSGKNPEDPLGWFYLGYARAAREKFGAAVAPYEKAIEKGLKQYKSYYQLGYSAHRAERHDVAERALREALKLKPEDPDALFHLGVSQLERSKPAEAESTLGRLLDAPSRWTELARFHRALARRKLGRQREAEEDLRWVIRFGQSDELRNRSQELLEPVPQAEERPEVPPGRKPWSFVAYQKGGYDSNVLRLPETSQSQGTEESDLYLMTFLMGSVEALEQDRLTFRLSLLDVSYQDLDEFALDALLAAVENETPLAEEWALEFSGHGELYTLDRESLLRNGGIKGGVRHLLSERMSVGGGGLLMRKDYRQDSLDELDSLEKGGYMEFRSERAPEWLDLTIRYELDVEDADAADRSSLANDLMIRSTVRIDDRWEVRVEQRVAVREYDERDRLLLKTRRDARIGVRAAVSYRLLDPIQVFVEAEFERNDSNLSAFDYTRRVFGLGLLVVF